MIEKIETLFEKAKQLHYDECCGMKVVDKMKGSGFFPGCTGFHNNPSDIKNTFVMVVGQDFATEEYHQKIGDKGEVDSNTTWRNLKTLLKDIRIDEDICFFTNAYIGLRKNGKNTGQSPAKKSPNFTQQCQKFFKEQLSVINPELVLILGKEPAKFVAQIFPDYFAEWKKMKLLKQFYEDEENISCTLKFENKKIQFLFALHPSMSNTNRPKIWGKGVKGREKETDMLKKHLSNFYIRHNLQ
jgi:uracil-DNA glycosylase